MTTTETMTCHRDYCGHAIEDHHARGTTKCIACPCPWPLDEDRQEIALDAAGGAETRRTLFDPSETGNASLGAAQRETAPYNRNSPTSFAAARSQQPEKVSNDQQRILDLMRRRVSGITCDEAEEQLAMLHQTASAHFVKLKARGLIRATSQVRRTRNDQPAAVYEVTRRGIEHLRKETGS